MQSYLRLPVLEKPPWLPPGRKAKPTSVLLARMIGLSFIDYPLPAIYSPGGILTWAALVAAISILASLFPALRAVRLTVTQVLAYE